MVFWYTNWKRGTQPTWKIEIYRLIHQRNIFTTFDQKSAKEKFMTVRGNPHNLTKYLILYLYLLSLCISVLYCIIYHSIPSETSENQSYQLNKSLIFFHVIFLSFTTQKGCNVTHKNSNQFLFLSLNITNEGVKMNGLGITIKFHF